MEMALGLLAAVLLCLPVVLAIKWSGAAAFLRGLLTGRRLAAVVACALAAALVCGGVRWYQTLGRIHETHTVEEYRFRITSERDPDCDDITEMADYVSISVSHGGQVVAERTFIGYVDEHMPAPTFTARRLPNESLIVVTRNGREGEAVFAYDTATGACYPQPLAANWRDRYEASEKLCKALEARIRACPGYERCELNYLRWH